jgi:hypothetical protein
MGMLPDVNVVDTTADSDLVVMNQGRKTVQQTKANFLDGVGGGTFANVIDATAGSYALVPNSEAPVTIVSMTGTAAGLTLTIPTGSFTLGAIFEVTNNDVDEVILLTLAVGVTCINVTSGASEIASTIDEEGISRVKLVNIGTNIWAAYGDITVGA